MEVTFATVCDIANAACFMSAIHALEVLTPGQITVGTRFRETRTMFGQSASEEMTVSDIDPPRRLVLTAYNHGTAYRSERICSVEAAGTRLALIFAGHPATLAARMLAPLGWLFKGSVRRQLTHDLADLKRESERRHHTAGT